MYAPYPENMMESIKKVEATRAERMATEPRRLTADEKDALLKKFHPDYNPDAFAEIKVGANKGQKAPLQLAEMLHSTSRLIKDKVDITKVDYDVDVLVIGGKESPAYQDRSLRGKVYSDIYAELKRQFGITTYKAIKRNQCETAISVIDNYHMPYFLAEQVYFRNAQLNLWGGAHA